MSVSATMIGIDPHKRSHTAVVVDPATERVTARLRVEAGPGQVDQLLAWAPSDPSRRWAVENPRGCGLLLAQQLVAAGETVIAVPAALAARTRVLSGRSARKTDAEDARSVTIAAQRHHGLPLVTADGLPVLLGVLVDRRGQLVAARQRLICQLHAVMAEIVPGGAKQQLSRGSASRLLRGLRPQDPVAAARAHTARQLLEDWRWYDKRVAAAHHDLLDQLARCHTGLTGIHGIGPVGAATIISVVGDVGRFPTAGHFASFNGTAPIEASSGDNVRHRLNRRGNRQLNKVLHTAAVCQKRGDTPGRAYAAKRIAAGDNTLGATRKLKRQISNAVYRQLRTDQGRSRNGQQGTNPKVA